MSSWPARMRFSVTTETLIGSCRPFRVRRASATRPRSVCAPRRWLERGRARPAGPRDNRPAAMSGSTAVAVAVTSSLTESLFWRARWLRTCSDSRSRRRGDAGAASRHQPTVRRAPWCVSTDSGENPVRTKGSTLDHVLETVGDQEPVAGRSQHLQVSRQGWVIRTVVSHSSACLPR